MQENEDGSFFSSSSSSEKSFSVVDDSLVVYAYVRNVVRTYISAAGGYYHNFLFV